MRQIRQAATPTLKTQLEIGKEYHDMPRGKRAAFAASSPYGDTVLRRYAAKYREIKRTGNYKGEAVGWGDLRKIIFSGAVLESGHE